MVACERFTRHQCTERARSHHRQSLRQVVRFGRVAEIVPEGQTSPALDTDGTRCYLVGVGPLFDN